MPPSSTVPPSGTLTVVVTVTNAKVGNCTVVPEFVVELELLALFHMVAGVVAFGNSPERVLLVVVVVAPVNWKVFTAPMLLKKGTTVSRTNRRSLETTA